MTRDEAVKILESGIGDIREAQLILQEMGVRSVYAASMSAELREMLRVWACERGFEGDLSEVLDGVGLVLDNQIKRIGERPESYWKQLSVWLRGYEIMGSEEVAKNDRWALVRKAVRDYLSGVSFEELSLLPSDGSLVEDLKPLVKELKKESMRVVRSGELAGDKVLNAFRDVVRLYGTASGELSQKVDVAVGPNQAFKAIIGMKQVEVMPAEFELLE